MSTPRVLVVEDSKVIQRLIDICLRSEAVDVIFRDDGVAGLDAALESLPALIVLDVGLPEMDGWQVLAELRLRPETVDIEVLVLTANASEEAKRRAEDHRAGILAKPFRPDDLREAVTRLTGAELSTDPARVGAWPSS